MKGIVFTLFNELVEQQFGLEAWDSLLRNTGQDGVYTAASTYPDEQILKMVGGLSEQSGLPAQTLVHAFGKFMLKGFVQQYPTFFQGDVTAKQLLKSVDGIIHIEVKKLFPDAILPSFEYEDPCEDQLVMIYRSDRKLCSLAEGLIDGTAEHFGASISRRHTECLLNGDDHCRLELTFGSQEGDAA